jgi:hypothetical protein
MTQSSAFQKKNPLRQPDWVAAILVTVIIVGLHIFFLFHAGGFCGDEVNVINLAGSHSLSFMARDSFPILMPLLVNSWTAMGLANSDLTLRLLGMLIGLGMIGALWLSAWTARRAPPLLSLTLLGLNGTVIFWGDYLRAYGLGSLLIMLTLSAMCFLLGKPTWWRTVILSVMAVLSVQALYQNSVFFASIGLGGWMVCLLRKDKGTALKIFAAGLVAVISLLPYWECVLKWPQSTTIRPGFSFVAAADNFNTVTGFPLPLYVWVWKLLGLAVVGLGVAVFFRPPQRSSQSGDRMTSAELQVFAGTTLLAALVGYFIFLYFAALITSPWYFLPLMALGASCFDLGIPLTTLPRLFRAVVWGSLIATIGVAVPFAARDLNCRFTNVDLVVKSLMKEISPQDYVVVTPWYLGISFNRYYKGAAVWDTLPPVADHSTYRFDLVPTTATEKTRASRSVLDRIASTLQTGHRVWIVGLMSVPAPGRAAATAEGRFIAEHSQSFEPLDLKIKSLTSDYEEESLLMARGWKTNSP